MKIYLEIDAEECPYWNYNGHTPTHTCNDCECIYEGNNIKNSHSGLMVGLDRYCTLHSNIRAKMVEVVNELNISMLKS